LGNFKQTRTIKKLNREFVSTGSFAIDRDAGILWDTQKPFASVMLVGDNSIVQWDAARDVKKTMSAKDNPVFAEFSKTIQSVFSGKFDELERNFKIYFEKKGDVFSIGLVPKEKAVANVIGSIVLEGRSELEKVTIVDGEENPVVYEFTQHRHFANLESVDASLADLARKFQKLK
jgi:outer membrane lipoprotein-sorting protein